MSKSARLLLKLLFSLVTNSNNVLHSLCLITYINNSIPFICLNVVWKTSKKKQFWLQNITLIIIAVVFMSSYQNKLNINGELPSF